MTKSVSGPNYRQAKSVQASHPAANRRWGILIWLSVALHGALLMLPTPGFQPAEPEPEAPIEESGAIALTTLPTIAKPEPAAPVDPAPPAVTPTAPLTQVPEVLPPEVLEDTTEVNELEPVPELPLQTTDPEPADSEPEGGIAVQFSADFPHLTGSQSGCYGLDNCRIAEGQNYTDALREISERLETQGYTLTPYTGNDDSDVRNHRIFEMRLPSDPDADVKYLNVFGEGLKTAIYIITPRIITQEDLQSLEENSQGS
ncbi:MAG: hypothetical protein AAF282_08340 [Cyanobacteria bacterium P01_A01_bin.15]